MIALGRQNFRLQETVTRQALEEWVKRKIERAAGGKSG